MNLHDIISAIILIGAVGLISSVILFFVSKAFHVEEDTRVEMVTERLPGAYCGGCGFPGCKGLAEAIVKAGSMENLTCPVADNDTTTDIAEILGISAIRAVSKIAVLKCNGAINYAPVKAFYDSAINCAIAASIFSGENACPYGCLGCGDCVNSCRFEAITINPQTKLPEIDEEKCVGCSACTKVCPRNLLEIRDKGHNKGRIYVACSNKEKGVIARRNCAVACIGCGKCVKICKSKAIIIENNLAYINQEKCTLCGKCVPECPTKIIKYENI